MEGEAPHGTLPVAEKTWDHHLLTCLAIHTGEEGIDDDEEDNSHKNPCALRVAVVQIDSTDDHEDPEESVGIRRGQPRHRPSVKYFSLAPSGTHRLK